MMLVEGGGGGGPLGNPLAGLQMPPGSPDPLSHTASQLSHWASSLGQGASGNRSASDSVVNSAWIGPDATTAGKSVEQISAAAATMSDAADHANQALTTCATNWEAAIKEWKQATTLAAQAMAQEKAHRAAAAQSLAAMTAAQKAADPTQVSTLTDAASGNDGYTSPDRSKAVAMGEEAVLKAQHAISVASATLATVGGAVKYAATAPDVAKDNFIDQLMDGLSKGNSVIGSFLAGAMGRAGFSYATLANDLEKTFSEATDAQISRWADMLDSGYDTEEIVQGMASFIHNMDLAGAAFKGQEIENLISGGLKFLGESNIAKWGVRGLGGLAIVGDVWTMFNPDEGGAWGDVERGMAGGNLIATAGGMGLDMAGDAATLAMVNAGLDWIPVAGQVVAIGTGLYLAGDYLYTHAAWFRNSINWAGSEISKGAQWVAHTASSAWHTATHVVSDLDPLNW